MEVQDWGAYGPGGCRIGGDKAPEIAGPTDTKFLLTAGGCRALRPRGMGQLDDGAVGYGGEG